MGEKFQANCLPVLIGSLPMDDHTKALKLVLEYTPEIPLWVQLPAYKEEGMMVQFLPGMPGQVMKENKVFVNTDGDAFDEELLEFYEDYLAVTDGGADLSESRFVMTPDTAFGFFEFLKQIDALPDAPVAVKGQITGPITLGTGVTDEKGKAIFYDERIKDAAVKILAMKAGWQARELSKFGCPVIIFFDEPALTGFGSSAFISISREDIAACFDEVIEPVHKEGGLAGIHVCANAEWPLILESSADIVSFDAYSYFDKFLLYPDALKHFFEAGKIVAWGIVPTLNAEDVERETTGSLVSLWEERLARVEALGIEKSTILAQSLITPSCGTGSLSLDHATKVLELTKEVSEQIRVKNKL